VYQFKSKNLAGKCSTRESTLYSCDDVISGHVVLIGAEETCLVFEGGNQSFGRPKGECVIALT
jgi:hypothetical protein